MRKVLNPLWQLISLPFRIILWPFTAIYRFIANTVRRVRYYFTEEVEDASVTDAVSKAFEDPTGILEHIDALRKHLLRATLFLIVTTAISFIFIQQIMGFLARPLEGGLSALQAIEVTEPVGTVMRVALLSGFALAFPYIALELWLFIAPGLNGRERIYGLIAVPLATIFLVMGMAFAYYFMLPVGLPILLNFMGLNTMARPQSYFSFVTSLMFWIGVAFEFPLVIFVLARLGFVNARMLFQQWRVAVVIIAVVAAFVTPTVDPVNMGLVMSPLIVLYFLSIGLAWIGRRKAAGD